MVQDTIGAMNAPSESVPQMTKYGNQPVIGAVRVGRMNCALGLLLLPALTLILLSAGCGGSSPPDCSTALALGVLSSSPAADHLAAPPGNKVSFFGFDVLPAGCPPTPGPIRPDLHWTVSDTANVTIGNTANVDYGVATCINATPAPATVTATGTNQRGATISGTATLTCK